MLGSYETPGLEHTASDLILALRCGRTYWQPASQAGGGQARHPEKNAPEDWEAHHAQGDMAVI